MRRGCAKLMNKEGRTLLVGLPCGLYCPGSSTPFSVATLRVGRTMMVLTFQTQNRFRRMDRTKRQGRPA